MIKRNDKDGEPIKYKALKSFLIFPNNVIHVKIGPLITGIATFLISIKNGSVGLSKKL